MKVLFKNLAIRRHELGISYSNLARLSGVCVPTVQRILSGGHAEASFANVAAIAEALGIRVEFKSAKPVAKVRLRQAKEKARKLTRLLQGTMGLEGQAVDEASIHELARRTAEELLSGSNLRLWSD